MQTWQITNIDKTQTANIQATIDNKTKPVGSLGQLESLAMQIALVQQAQKGQPLTSEKTAILIFAGDHGIADAGVSIAPSEVTGQMLANFIAGGAAINCFCRANQVELKVINAGVKFPPDIQSDSLINKSIAAGTFNIAEQAAMSQEHAELALQYGSEVVAEQIAQGFEFIGFGEMGIGNTSAASALLAAVLNLPAADCVGRGTGISDQQLELKIALVQQSIDRVKHSYAVAETDNLLDTVNVESLLAELGGFEIAQIVGAMLKTAELGKLIIVDGFIVSVAALIASRIAPSICDYFIFAHQSNEQAHQLILTELAAKPLLQLDLRLGEGTGAALAVPLIRSAIEFYNHMATFESAQVTAV